MPQMSPLYWLILFISFSSMLMISMVKNYFSTQKKISLKQETLIVEKNQMNWKW